MVANWGEDVRAFHRLFGIAPAEDGMVGELFRLRRDRLWEEYIEYMDAPDILGKFDGLVDLIYIAVGGIVGTLSGARSSHEPYGFGTFAKHVHGVSRYPISISGPLSDIGEAIVWFGLREGDGFGQRMQCITIMKNAVALACNHGLHRFDDGWTRVHTANMQKVRCERKDDSRHGTTFDIIKPDGWRAPVLSDLLTMEES